MFENSDEILTVAQVSEMLYIGINTTYELLNTGKIKGFRVGRVWKIPRDALIASFRSGKGRNYLIDYDPLCLVFAWMKPTTNSLRNTAFLPLSQSSGTFQIEALKCTFIDNGMRYTQLHGLLKVKIQAALTFACMNLKNWQHGDTSAVITLRPSF